MGRDKLSYPDTRAGDKNYIAHLEMILTNADRARAADRSELATKFHIHWIPTENRFRRIPIGQG